MTRFSKKSFKKLSKTINFHWNPYLHVFTNLVKIFEKSQKKSKKKTKKKSKKKTQKRQKKSKKVTILQKKFQKNLELPHAMPAPFKLTLLTQFRKAPGST